MTKQLLLTFIVSLFLSFSTTHVVLAQESADQAITPIPQDLLEEAAKKMAIEPANSDASENDKDSDGLFSDDTPSKAKKAPETEKPAEPIGKPAETKTKADGDKKVSIPLLEGLEEARDILVGDQQESAPFIRGMILPLFQPLFMLVMLGLGLWAGQMHEKLASVWAIPLSAVGAMSIAAFITVFIPDARPTLTFGGGENLLDLTAIDSVAVIPAVLVGLIVGLRLSFVSIIAIVIAALIGLLFGFTPLRDISSFTTDYVLFWLGFGVTGLFGSIFGLGMELFLRTLSVEPVVRALGFITLLAGIAQAVTVF